MYAISAASLTYTMARACANGALHQCTCGEPPENLAKKEFKWGGCGDNVRWGANFAKRFIDNVEKHNANSENPEGVVIGDSATDKKTKFKIYVAAVNLHNNRIGRKVYIIL